MLRNVPQPTEALVQSAPKANESASIGMDLNSGLFPFLQLPYNMDIRVTNLATQITAGMPTMYDKVMALESYLRTHYIYDLSVKVPSGQEAVSWFLFNSGNRGYCTDFATAMAIMARSVGIPARVVSGYAPGTYDSRLNQQIIHGTDAHSWTQIYFPGYGWVNFEPTPGYATFNRAPPTFVSPQRINSASGYRSATSWIPYRTIATVIGGLSVIALVLGLLSLLWLQRLRPQARAGELYRRVCLFATCAGCAPQLSQTPREYLQRLLLVMPQARKPLERLCDLYIREQWAHPASAEHPYATGGVEEVPHLWLQLCPQLRRAILSHWCRRILFKNRQSANPPPIPPSSIL